jgi:type I restriction enzyme, S subunit
MTPLSPKLRFLKPDGGNFPYWENKLIHEILTIGSGRDHKNLKDGNIPVFGSGGYMRSVDQALFSGETICIGRKGTIDQPFYFEGEFWTVDTLFYTHSFQSVLPKFVFALFQRINWKSHNEAGGVPSLSKSIINNIRINLPSLPEQQKIATFLSAVDKKIQLLQLKKKLLGQYKKGAMQKIFSQQIRFKDENGNDYPDWEEKKLGEYIDLLSGFAFKGSTISENPSGKPLLRGVNITEGEIRHSNEMDRYYLGPTDILNKYIVIENDLVIGMDGSKVGKNSSLISQSDEGALLVQRVARIRPTARSNIRYIYQLIRSPKFIRYVDTVNTSSGIPHISLKQIKDFLVPMPSLNEQDKIGNLLMEMDTKISLMKLSISKMKYFKKGLLQQMFV